MKVTEGYCLPPSQPLSLYFSPTLYYVRSKFEYGLSCVARSKNGLRKVVGRRVAFSSSQQLKGDGGA